MAVGERGGMMIPKLRAWDKEKQKMLVVNNICNLFWESKFIECYELLPDPKGKHEYELIDHRIDLDDAIIMESTGLFDISTPQKEIFESDIVEWEHKDTGQLVRGIVKYDAELGFWGMTDVRFNDLRAIGYLANQRVTVLGNIYQNKELVGDK